MPEEAGSTCGVGLESIKETLTRSQHKEGAKEDMKARNQWVDTGIVGRVLSTADDRGVPRGIVVDLGGIVRGACRSFARTVDWQYSSQTVSCHGDSGLEDLEAGYKLSEDHEGLHSGRFISVSVLWAANALATKGGYYDRYWQPRTVYKQSVPLREVTAQALGRLLMEMHDRLGKCTRGGST